MGFSLQWLLLLWGTGSRASVVAVCELGIVSSRIYSTGSVVVAHGLHSMWILADLPIAGITSASPGLASGFFTTEPPGKPSGIFLILVFHTCTWRPGSRGLATGSPQPQFWPCRRKLWGLRRVPQLSWDCFLPSDLDLLLIYSMCSREQDLVFFLLLFSVWTVPGLQKACAEYLLNHRGP